MTTSSSTMVRWGDLDPFLTGPYRASVETEGKRFDVPSSSSRNLQCGRIVSGEGWPPHLPTIDRLAIVPAIQRDRIGQDTCRRDTVLYFEPPGRELIPICTRHGDDLIRWNFHPAEWIHLLLSEAYVSKWARPLPSWIPFFNYSHLPHSIKGLLQRARSPVSGYVSRPVAFPTVPLDSLVDTIRQLCHALWLDSASRLAGLWPGNRRAAVTLTHDVDTGWILEVAQSSLLKEILEVESSLGFKGAWYITADQLNPTRQHKALKLILEAGHEIGAHGWNHDSKLSFLSVARQEKRMLRIKERFAGLDIEGIRTPWYSRSGQMFDVLSRHFFYDSSVPNSSGYFSIESNSGCCSLFPYRPHSGLFELPMTLPPDTALHPEEGYDSLWALSHKIIERGGVVVTTLHPQPHQSGNKRRLAPYYAYLRKLASHHGQEVWCATPREIVRHYSTALT